MLRREDGKSFSLLGSLTMATKTEVTFTTPAGAVETLPRSDLIFVHVGGLNHFARLHPELLVDAFGDSPLLVFEQALVDAPNG